MNISIFYRWSYGIVMWEVFTIGMSSNVENFPLATGHNTLTITSFIWQLRLSKTIVDSLTLKISGRILRFRDNGSDEIVQILTCKTRMKRQTC